MDTSGFFIMMKEMKYVVHTPQEMSRATRALLAHAWQKYVRRACIVGLSGELGAGKTTFTKVLARELGIKRNIISPTFILERVYMIPRTHVLSKRFSRLVHIDAYRLTEHDGAFATHLSERMHDPKNLIVIEWPERIQTLLPKQTFFISFAHKDEHTRIITLGARLKKHA